MNKTARMEIPSGLTVQRLTGSIGVRIGGVDLRRGVSQSEYRLIRDAVARNNVAVLPGQNITEDAQVAFGAMFGAQVVHPIYPSLAGYPTILEITNVGKRDTITEIWHSDTSSLGMPPSFTMLLAREIPDAGGDTMFANQYAAFAALSTPMQDMLSGLNAVHESASERSIHPVIRIHPETGLRALFVNGYFVKNFDGMSEEESKPLLQFLFEWAVKPEFTYRHRWSVNDLVIWDNRCTQHYAVHDYGDAPRRMHRIMIEGEEPG